MRRPETRFPILCPIIVLVITTMILRWTNWDTHICGLFFGGNGSWPGRDLQPFRFLYEFGVYPGLAVAVAGSVVWLVGLATNYDLARRGLFCVLVAAVGPGLIINGALKPNMNRPRPCQIIEFQGTADFRPVLSIGPKYDKLVCRSFPSGHASMGFSMICVPLLLRRRRWLFVVTLGVAIGTGLMIGITRIVQGGHYPSDVLWSAGIVYLVAVALYYLMGLNRQQVLAPAERVFDTGGELVSTRFRPVKEPQVAPVPLPRKRGLAA